MKSSLMVYPYDLRFSPVLRHPCFLNSFSVKALVSPAGWGLAGKDAGFADGGSDLGMIVSSDFENSLCLCDTAMFVNAERAVDFKTFIYPKVLTAVDSGKNILFAAEAGENIIEDIMKRCGDKGVLFTDTNLLDSQNIRIGKDKIYKISVPVIYVMAAGEQNHKFEIQLSLGEYFTKAGYKVSMVGSRTDCGFLGIRRFPDFMLKNGISESQKVILFNHYIRTIEKDESPDIIIVGIPGGISAFCDEINSGFGVLAYEISQAVIPDIAILSVPYEDYKSAFFENMYGTVKGKFGFGVDCFNIANLKIDWASSKMLKKISNIVLDYSFVDKKKSFLNSLSAPVFNVLNKNDSAAMAEHIISKLNGYAQVETV